MIDTLNYGPNSIFLSYCLYLTLFCIRFDKSGNQDLALSLVEWVFKEKGVLRVGKVTHHKAGDKNPPAAYTILDDVVSKYSFVIYFHL